MESTWMPKESETCWRPQLQNTFKT